MVLLVDQFMRQMDDPANVEGMPNGFWKKWEERSFKGHLS